MSYHTLCTRGSGRRVDNKTVFLAPDNTELPTPGNLSPSTVTHPHHVDSLHTPLFTPYSHLAAVSQEKVFHLPFKSDAPSRATVGAITVHKLQPYSHLVVSPSYSVVSCSQSVVSPYLVFLIPTHWIVIGGSCQGKTQVTSETHLRSRRY